MKSIQENIAVDARNRVPRRLRWEDRTYRVRRLLDYWILQTRWWGREEKRIYFRLETNRGIVEVYRAAESLLPGLAPAESGSSVTRSATPAPSHSTPAPSHATPVNNPRPSTLATRPSIPGHSPRPTTLDPRSSILNPRPSTVDPRPSILNPRSSTPLLPIEGDTHTRERRRTDAPYRPDVRIEENLRRKAARAESGNGDGRTRAADRDRPERVRWVLSKIMD